MIYLAVGLPIIGNEFWLWVAFFIFIIFANLQNRSKGPK